MTDENQIGIFVETSTQIPRLFGTQSEKSHIYEHLQGYQPCTSSMVYVEFKRTMLQTMALVAKTIAEAECAPDKEAIVRLGEISRWASNKPNVRGERKAKLVLKVIGAIIDWVEDYHKFYGRSPTIEAVKDYLLREIEKMANYWFFEFDGKFIKDKPERYINLTNCHWANDDIIPGISLHGPMSCKRDARECNTRTMLHNQWAIVESISNAFQACPDKSPKRDQTAIEGVVRAQRIIHQKASSNSASLGERCCWKLGDIIIGLECPDWCEYIHSYDHHFETICNVLGKTQVPVPSRTD